MPKYGIISMILRAYQDKVSDDISLLPVYLGYDRIIEEHSYLAELSGASKKSESAWDVIKHLKIIMHRYGRVYLNFGDPISLKTYFAAQTKNFAEMTAAEQQATCRDVGALVVSRINRVATATPVALAAAALLCRGGRETNKSLLAETFSLFHDYLTHRNVKMTPALSLKDEALTAAVQIFIEWACLVKKKIPEENNGTADAYLLPDDQRLRLEYYKNNIIHHFIPLSFLATAILACPEKEISFRLVRENYLFLKRIFVREFVLENDHDLELEENSDYLRLLGILKNGGQANDWGLGEGARERLLPFSGLVQSCLESYRAVFDACTQFDGEQLRENNQLNYIRTWAEKMYLRGGLSRAESLSGAYYANALKFLQGEAIIRSAGSRGEEKEGAVGALIDKDRLSALQRHLARFFSV
jgi:glycerol-3-phosphate O-acyltransferase